ncbi:4-hydroxy-3-methylbut-2-enyl diphosphate reductase [Flavipsychrobacter stenotrophus]|uniref:4-hydroxy-3-methylbut-2-enyl diphosphate reductase n=1 Tax=Flavipsychrobacter stenotrophus TaxID=2077091 RepID=A0A2S7SW17_9BACT|nr:4-hydroxy-3-methylbut-2-enyl diphosphate reductase [Flavipsychrobacter stenotrophus]PQJ11119.1 4-hydroxy-3-methylbut-2-enyl diphosphate reductase [Flavipsychrobacter stenotrophus]
MKSFNVPVHYRSPLVTAIKQKRKADDKMKKDFTPTVLELGSLHIVMARHFGFCYGVENAIEIAFRAVEENPGKRIFLLSEMIHNPGVNADLQALGIQFIMDTKGKMLMSWDELTPEDVVIIPAFGTTLETEQILRERGINPTLYETTCPFVEKVWNRAGKIGDDGYTIIVHGKPGHEETRATFSHSKAHTPTIVVKDMSQAELLGQYISRSLPADQFYEDFKGQFSEGFDVTKDLERIGVVNQTTMLASETQAIADYLREATLDHFGTPSNKASERVADTRDTLCYATNDNQSAVAGMLETDADFAFVIGGYNSSNTSHLVELCELKLPTYYISDEHCIVSANEIRHYNMHTHQEETTQGYLPVFTPIKVMITSGASCPDALVERVIAKLANITGNIVNTDKLIAEWS